jgi:two-component system chemotaxis response regulator CheB
MSAPRKKQVLFVDDEPALLNVFRELFGALSRGEWEISTAQNHAEALAQLRERKADLVVLDIGMPMMDGVQFLKLLGRTHPGLQVVMLTGLASEEKRKQCQELGAALFLEKPTDQAGYAAVFAALDALASALPQEGFRGMMRQVGLQEVLQMECLGAKSSVLEIFTSRVRGKIFIADGNIIHAECGQLQGDVALYSLLALRGGGFNLMPYAEPGQRTIEGNWEFLLMEAARLRDEGGEVAPPASEPEQMAEIPDVFAPASIGKSPAAAASPAPAALAHEPRPPRIAQTVLWSGGGELLHAWECAAPEKAKQLLEFIEQQAGQVSTTAAVGRFDRLEISTPTGRVIAQVQSDRRLLVTIHR